MLDIGWTEILVIAIVLIVVVGPKDLPPMLRAFGKMTGRLKNMAGEFRQQFDEALKDTEFDEVRKTLSDAQSLNPVNSLKDSLNPLRKLGEDIRNDLQKPVKTEAVTETAAVADEESFKLPEPSMALSDTPPVISEPVPAAAKAKKTAARKPRATDKNADAAATADAAKPAATTAKSASAVKKKQASTPAQPAASVAAKPKKAPKAESVAAAASAVPQSKKAAPKKAVAKTTPPKAATPKTKVAASDKIAAPRKTAARSKKTSDA